MSAERDVELAEQRATNRLEAFSDAVIAIAITLLVLEIHIPEAEGERSLWDELVDQWPSYLGFLTSFAIIGVMWINHHNLFKRIVRTDHNLLVVNLLLLLVIAAIPFTTALTAEHLTHDGERTATLVYSGWFLLVAVVFNLLWWYVAHRGKLLDPHTDPRAIRAIDRSYVLGFGAYIVAVLLAIVSPLASQILILLLAVWYILPWASAG